MATHATRAIDWTSMTDADLLAQAQRGRREAFRHLMQRCNQRLFRIARAVLGDDAEAEDVVQEAYTRAFAGLSGFRGDAAPSTWLTRIVLNEAYGRLRRLRPSIDIAALETIQDHRVLAFPPRPGAEDPVANAARAQIRDMLESAIDRLSDDFRVVFVMREIEGCSTEETATALRIRQETVKTRLHRARRALRADLCGALETTLGEAFPFLGARCTRMTQAVLDRLDAAGAWPPTIP